MTYPAFVRCKDNTLVRDVLAVGGVYECQGERYENYFVKGKWLTKGRFETATIDEFLAYRARIRG